MRVLIVVPDFPRDLDNIKGGVHSALANLLRGFRTLPVHIRVISFNREVKKESVIHYSPGIDIVYCTESPGFHLLNYLYKNSFDVKRHIREFKPDLVHFSMGGFCLFTKIFGLSRTKQLITIHGMAWPEARLKKKLKEKVVMYANGIVQVLLAPKNIIHLSNYSLKLHGLSKQGKYCIIPNAINSKYFDISVKENSENRLLYIGAIDNNKNILLLLESLKRQVEQKRFFSLEILGDFLTEEYKTEVQAYIRENQLSEYVKFYGWVPQATVAAVLSKADILVLCSRQESLPMVIAEAMSAGKVVVASRIGGIPEMITDETDGFLFNSNDSDQLTAILDKLYNNNSLTRVISKKAKEKAMLTFHCESVAKKTFQFYGELLK